MARDEAKRQKRLMKKRQKDKLRHKWAAFASTAYLSAEKKIRSARQFGFEPRRDFDLSQYVLDAAESIAPNPDLEFGREGKPVFIAGPDDDVPRILRQLEATAGRGHFNYLSETEYD